MGFLSYPNFKWEIVTWARFWLDIELKFGSSNTAVHRNSVNCTRIVFESLTKRQIFEFQCYNFICACERDVRTCSKTECVCLSAGSFAITHFVMCVYYVWVFEADPRYTTESCMHFDVLMRWQAKNTIWQNSWCVKRNIKSRFWHGERLNESITHL